MVRGTFKGVPVKAVQWESKKAVKAKDLRSQIKGTFEGQVIVKETPKKESLLAEREKLVRAGKPSFASKKTGGKMTYTLSQIKGYVESNHKWQDRAVLCLAKVEEATGCGFNLGDADRMQEIASKVTNLIEPDDDERRYLSEKLPHYAKVLWTIANKNIE
jgi:hypothetical protein